MNNKTKRYQKKLQNFIILRYSQPQKFSSFSLSLFHPRPNIWQAEITEIPTLRVEIRQFDREQRYRQWNASKIKIPRLK